MFKDFHRRLQRDLKKIVDARILASEARLGGEIKVRIVLYSFFPKKKKKERKKKKENEENWL